MSQRRIAEIGIFTGSMPCCPTGSIKGLQVFVSTIVLHYGGIDGGGLLISLDGVAPTRIVNVSASCYPP